jgi:TonB family protein
VAFCLIAFYLLFKLLLSKETFHSFNRLVLLLVMVVSILLPWVKVTTAEPTAIAEGMISIESVIASAEVVDSESPEGLTAIQLLFIIYIIGIAVFFLREVVSVFSLIRLIRRGTLLTAEQAGVSQRGVQVVVMKDEIAPFSWFRHVVLSEKDFRENPREILTHELAHIRLGHSWDVAVCNLLIIFQWWNPAAWLLKRELQNVHEFEADEAVIKRGVDAKQYQLLLIRKSVGERLFSMANNLNHHSLKKRITMMTTKKSSPWQKAKALIALPMAALAVMAFANPEIERMAEQVEAESEAVVSKAVAEVKTEGIAAMPQLTKQMEAELEEQAETVDEKVTVTGVVKSLSDMKPIVGAVVKLKGSKKGSVTDTEGRFSMKDVPVGAELEFMYVGFFTDTRKIEKGGEIEVMLISEEGPSKDDVHHKGDAFDVVEQMPSFPGGMKALMNYLQENIKYPKDAQDAKKEGRVIATFIVEKDGSISNVKIIRSIFPSLDAEAERIITGMPKWIPGMQNGETVRVKYTIPIFFSLGDVHYEVVSGNVNTDKNEYTEAYKNAKELRIASGNKVEKPLFVVDDKIIDNDDITKIKPNDIESVTVLKDESATKIYGEKGKNGVVIIKMKK